MSVFARFDLLSSLWRGSTDSRGQTRRIVDFLGNYLNIDWEIAVVAVHIWRHKLMHTSEPRRLTDPASGYQYAWLLHWGFHLPKEQHFTMARATGFGVLNLALVYLIEDLRRATDGYFDEMQNTPTLQKLYQAAYGELQKPEVKWPKS